MFSQTSTIHNNLHTCSHQWPSPCLVSTFTSSVCTTYMQMEHTWIHNWSALGTPFIACVQLISRGYQSGTKSRYTHFCKYKDIPIIYIIYFIYFIKFYFEVNKSTILLSLDSPPSLNKRERWGTWDGKDWERESALT